MQEESPILASIAEKLLGIGTKHKCSDGYMRILLVFRFKQLDLIDGLSILNNLLVVAIKGDADSLLDMITDLLSHIEIAFYIIADNGFSVNSLKYFSLNLLIDLIDEYRDLREFVTALLDLGNDILESIIEGGGVLSIVVLAIKIIVKAINTFIETLVRLGKLEENMVLKIIKMIFKWIDPPQYILGIRIYNQTTGTLIIGQNETSGKEEYLADNGFYASLNDSAFVFLVKPNKTSELNLTITKVPLGEDPPEDQPDIYYAGVIWAVNENNTVKLGGVLEEENESDSTVIVVSETETVLYTYEPNLWADITTLEYNISATIDIHFNITLNETPRNASWILLLDEVAIANGSGFEGSITINVSMLDLGFHTIAIIAYNDSTTYLPGVASISIRITDNTPPSFLTIEPETLVIINRNELMINWSVMDNHRVDHIEIYINNSHMANTTANNYTLHFTSEGLFNVTIVAIDSTGNIATKQISVLVDLTPPEAKITVPSNDSILNKQNFILLWNATDNYEVNHTEVYIDSILIATVANTSLNINALDGYHNITIKVVDEAGNTATDTIIILIDSTPPQIEILSPINNTILNIGTITINWSATDNINIDHIEVYLDDVLVVETTNNSYKLSFYDDGYHIIRLVAIDEAGNNASAKVIVLVDTTPPSISSVTYPKEAFIGEQILITVQASDNIEISKITLTYEANGTTTIVELTLKDNKYVTTVTFNTTGTFRFVITAYDIANNTAISQFEIIIKEKPTQGLRLPVEIILVTAALISVTLLILIRFKRRE